MERDKQKEVMNRRPFDRWGKYLSVSVMAHPSREQFFPYLREKLGQDVPFSIDEKSEGVWPNCRRSWELFDPEAMYHVVVQDDAIVCDNFVKRAEDVICRAIERVNRRYGTNGELPAINFYYGSRANMKEEAEAGLSQGFIIKPTPKWGVAICLPTEIIPEMLEWTKRCSTWRDDARIGMFLADKGIRTYFPMPSLISHRSAAETPSLIEDPGKHRKAYKFIDE